MQEVNKTCAGKSRTTCQPLKDVYGMQFSPYNIISVCIEFNDLTMCTGVRKTFKNYLYTMFVKFNLHLKILSPCSLNNVQFCAVVEPAFQWSMEVQQRGGGRGEEAAVGEGPALRLHPPVSYYITSTSGTLTFRRAIYLKVEKNGR